MRPLLIEGMFHRLPAGHCISFLKTEGLVRIALSSIISFRILNFRYHLLLYRPIPLKDRICSVYLLNYY